MPSLDFVPSPDPGLDIVHPIRTPRSGIRKSCTSTCSGTPLGRNSRPRSGVALTSSGPCPRRSPAGELQDRPVQVLKLGVAVRDRPRQGRLACKIAHVSSSVTMIADLVPLTLQCRPVDARSTRGTRDPHVMVAHQPVKVLAQARVMHGATAASRICGPSRPLRPAGPTPVCRGESEGWPLQCLATTPGRRRLGQAPAAAPARPQRGHRLVTSLNRS